MSNKCILEEEKICDTCCDCYVCDLDYNKICDNCAECLGNADYTGLDVDGIEIN